MIVASGLFSFFCDRTLHLQRRNPFILPLGMPFSFQSRHFFFLMQVFKILTVGSPHLVFTFGYPRWDAFNINFRDPGV